MCKRLIVSSAKYRTQNVSWAEAAVYRPSWSGSSPTSDGLYCSNLAVTPGQSGRPACWVQHAKQTVMKLQYGSDRLIPHISVI
jgi:hypothetical protein